MRNRKPGKRVTMRRNLVMWLVVAMATSWSIACCPRGAPSNSGTDKRDATHPSEPIKVGDKVFPSLRDYVESIPDRCSNVAPALAKRQEIQRKLEAFQKTNSMLRKRGSVAIKVYFHVITNYDRAGDVTDGAIQNQIDVLNSAFVNTPFIFELAGKDRTSNDEWFNMEYSEPAGQAERAAKARLNQGDASTLNIYSVNLSGNAFGWARWPWDFADGVDGVVVGYQNLPGGEMSNFNVGYTAVHEVGHWLGLFHTFENSCDGEGDSVTDTPDEASPGKYCPVARNSCPSDGYDPVDNYMDFTWDICMNNFTGGQSERMDGMHQLYRQ